MTHTHTTHTYSLKSDTHNTHLLTHSLKSDTHTTHSVTKEWLYTHSLKSGYKTFEIAVMCYCFAVVAFLQINIYIYT